MATVLDSVDLKDAEAVTSSFHLISPRKLFPVSPGSNNLVPICMFAIAAVTNYPKLSGLKEHTFISFSSGGLEFLQVRSPKWVLLG